MRQVLHAEVSDYNIDISDDQIDKLKSDLDNFTAGKKRLIVISRKVYSLYKNYLNLDSNELLVLPDGEKEKNYKNYLKILNKAYKIGLTRQDAMVAIGGGVIGDITGFAASTYMRGIDYIQIPTTLLSMVDSSVGGKTAIDLPEGKNVVGTFYQPKAVFININFLKTLDKRQFRSGIGEVLKYALIEESCEYDKPIFFFEYLTLCCDKLLEKDTVTLIRVIDYCLKLKLAVVNSDEKESSLRKILNLGHTLGHALETVTNYKKFTHGEAVVYGMFFALNIAFRKGLINYSYYHLSIELLEKYGFKNITSYNKFNNTKLIKSMKKDKKANSDAIIFILPSEKKKVKEYKFDENAVKEFLN